MALSAIVLLMSLWQRGIVGYPERRDSSLILKPQWAAGSLPKSSLGSLPFSHNPAIKWRGVHLFVGPHALEFQRRLISRVLKPLGFNYVVLECERTTWRSAPGIANPDTISPQDLAKLFALYRRNHIEPIPLIESFGHMRWLLGNKKNLPLAYRNDVNVLDAQNPKARNLIRSIWHEAIDLLHPKVVHFGLDEVNFKGLPPEAVEKMWATEIRFLASLARESHVRPMLWGDMFLGPGEGPDNNSAGSIRIATLRRGLLPHGSLIGDWHYVPDPKASAYNSLGIWKRGGQSPIASEWDELPNIKGSTLAAEKDKAGTLITTWAGYSSEEKSMLSNTQQFAAFVFASEANANPEAAGYRLAGLGSAALKGQLRARFQSLYFGPTDQGGEGWLAQLGVEPIVIPRNGVVVVQSSKKGTAMVLDLHSIRNAREGLPIAEVDFDYQDGTRERHKLLAGLDIATPRIWATFRAEGSRTRFKLRPVPLRSVEFHSLSRAILSLKAMEIVK